MEEELRNLVLKALPNPKTFRFNNNIFTCYVHDLHLTIKPINKSFQFSFTRSDPERLTSDMVYYASCFNSLSELEEGLAAAGSELERRGFIEIKLKEDSTSEIDSILDLVETKTVESNLVESNSEPPRYSKAVYFQKTREVSFNLKQAFITTLIVIAVNLPLSFLLSRIWVQTMLRDLAKEMAKDLIQQEKR
ncbi:hypothetical protein [Calothrix sp. 336/3]|uniref:hypothetical protein n=1 Tax=Calothrix sp. 336/3 TaxID=1337936 RepID=UPI0004E40333|nr:hypothetical protein [Calothrix sp. 336/3]AKG21472.1 hypothetical protein IJ00_09385 [Calothrix sp. 336/3]